MMPGSQLNQSAWQLDKRIPLTLVFLVITQTFGFVWAASTLSGDVKNLRETTIRLEKQMENLNDKYDRNQATFLTRVEANRESERINTRLNHLEERVRYVEQRAIGKPN